MHEPAAPGNPLSGSPLHYAKLCNLAQIDWGGSGMVMPLAGSTPEVGVLHAGLLDAGFGANAILYMSVAWAAHEDYKAAHDIDVWANYVKSPSQNWWDYWNHYREGGVVHDVREFRALFGVGVNANTEAVFSEVAQAMITIFAHTDDGWEAPPLEKLEEAHHHGWTPKLLVARSVLTLWALLAMAPIMHLEPPLGWEAVAAEVSDPMQRTFDTFPGTYSHYVQAHPGFRIAHHTPNT